MLLSFPLLFAAQNKHKKWSGWLLGTLFFSLYLLELDTTTLDHLSQKARREREREWSVYVVIHLMLAAPPPLTKHHLSHLLKVICFSINNPILLFQLWFSLCLIVLSSWEIDTNLFIIYSSTLKEEIRFLSQSPSCVRIAGDLWNWERPPMLGVGDRVLSLGD